MVLQGAGDLPLDAIREAGPRRVDVVVHVARAARAGDAGWRRSSKCTPRRWVGAGWPRPADGGGSCWPTARAASGRAGAVPPAPAGDATVSAGRRGGGARVVLGVARRLAVVAWRCWPPPVRFGGSSRVSHRLPASLPPGPGARPWSRVPPWACTCAAVRAAALAAPPHLAWRPRLALPAAAAAVGGAAPAVAAAPARRARGGRPLAAGGIRRLRQALLEASRRTPGSVPASAHASPPRWVRADGGAIRCRTRSPRWAEARAVAVEVAGSPSPPSTWRRAAADAGQTVDGVAATLRADAAVAARCAVLSTQARAVGGGDRRAARRCSLCVLATDDRAAGFPPRPPRPAGPASPGSALDCWRRLVDGRIVASVPVNAGPGLAVVLALPGRWSSPAAVAARRQGGRGRLIAAVGRRPPPAPAPTAARLNAGHAWSGRTGRRARRRMLGGRSCWGCGPRASSASCAVGAWSPATGRGHGAVVGADVGPPSPRGAARRARPDCVLAVGSGLNVASRWTRWPASHDHHSRRLCRGPCIAPTVACGWPTRSSRWPAARPVGAPAHGRPRRRRALRRALGADARATRPDARRGGARRPRKPPASCRSGSSSPWSAAPSRPSGCSPSHRLLAGALALTAPLAARPTRRPSSPARPNAILPGRQVAHRCSAPGRSPASRSRCAHAAQPARPPPSTPSCCSAWPPSPCCSSPGPPRHRRQDRPAARRGVAATASRRPRSRATPARACREAGRPRSSCPRAAVGWSSCCWPSSRSVLVVRDQVAGHPRRPRGRPGRGGRPASCRGRRSCGAPRPLGSTGCRGHRRHVGADGPAAGHRDRALPSPTDVPLVGPLVGDLTLAADATMRVEPEPGAQASREDDLAGGGWRPPCRAARCSCRTWATARTTGSPSRHGQRPSTSRVARRWRSAGLVAELGDAGAAGVAVVDDDGGQAGVGLERGGHAADVPAVADGEQRQHADGGVLDGVQRARPPSAGSDAGGGQHLGRRSCTRTARVIEPCWGAGRVLAAERPRRWRRARRW